MLRPYTPNRKESRSADPRSVRGGAPSFAVTRTLAVDNNPALKAPKSGNGGPFSELGAGIGILHVEVASLFFSSTVPHPFFIMQEPLKKRVTREVM